MKPAGYIIIILVILAVLLFIKWRGDLIRSAKEKAKAGKTRGGMAAGRPGSSENRVIQRGGSPSDDSAPSLDPYLGRTEPKVLGWVRVARSDLPDSVIAGHEDLGYFSTMLGLLPDRKTLVCCVAYESYEVEHQPGGLSADTNDWVTHYDYYRVSPREVSPNAVNELMKKYGNRQN